MYCDRYQDNIYVSIQLAQKISRQVHSFEEAYSLLAKNIANHHKWLKV